MVYKCCLSIPLTALFLLSAGCTHEPPPPPASLGGSYVGSYEFLEIRHDTDTVQAARQAVTVTFRRPVFSLRLAPGRPESERLICDCAGRYELGDGVLLNCSNVAPDTCGEPLLYPYGLFAIEQLADTLRMTRDTTYAESVRFVKRLSLLPSNR